MKTTFSPRLFFGSRRGYLALVVLLLLGFFGAAAGMLSLVFTSAAVVSKSFDLSRQDATLGRRLEKLVLEAVLAQAEVGRPQSEHSLEDELLCKLSELDAGGVSLRPVSLPVSFVPPSLYPSFVSAPQPFLSPSQALLNACSPELRVMLGNRVIEYSAHAFHFELKRDVLGREQSKIVPLELRLVTVPLTRFPVVAYELPNEIATAVDELFEDQPKSNAPLGLAPARDRARNASLHASAETLPYHYRRRASLAMAYQDLFSQSFVNRAVAFAGSTHSHDLDVEASQTAALAGLVRDASGASLDLGLAGSGDYGGVQADKALIFTVTRSPGRRIRLFDSVGTSNAAPLVLVLMGSSGAALTVQVGSVQRPVVLIGFNVQLEAAPGALWKGAVFLDRTSSFVAGLNGPLRLGHLSYAAGSRRVSAQAVLVDQALPETLEAVSPQVHYAAVNRISL